MAVSQNPSTPAKKKYHSIQQCPFWIYPQQNWKQGVQHIFMNPCSQQHYSKQPKGRSNSSVHEQIKYKQNVVHTLLFRLKKGYSSDT